MKPPSNHSVFALICPVCGGEVEKVATRPTSSLYACKECDCDVIVPVAAWEIARIKRQQRWPLKRTSLNPFRRVFRFGGAAASGRGTGA